MIAYPGVEAVGCFGPQFSVEHYRGLCVTSTRIGFAERKHMIFPYPVAVIRCGVFFLRFFVCESQKCVSKPL